MSEDVRIRDVRIRDVRDTDLEVFYEQQLDPEAVRRARFPARDRETFMTHWATKVLGDRTALVQAVTVDGETAGSIVAWWADHADRVGQADQAEEKDRQRFIGYWFGRQYWGRGVGTRSLGLFLRLEETRPLYADPFVGNTASVRLLERHGFRPSGTVRPGEEDFPLLVLHGEDAQPGR
ncbi:GNAT family N-acetyltransferase [Streptomyces sp. NPDC088747]|uniref:GNAT family N-acetyltransferase n=1 Tax=Streptomyces sp. NPDC088747 TaxID=3365886 RepID=UPI0038204C59